MPEVYPGIYSNVIPLPNNPLESINNYLVISKGEALMVDTAFNSELSVNKMKKILKEYDIDLTKLRLFFTHLHSDHTGLARRFEEAGTEIIMGKIDGDYVNNSAEADAESWKMLVDLLHVQGMDEDHLKIDDHPGYKFRPTETFKFTPVKEGDMIDVGDFHFQVIDLKGHTPGQQGLYEAEKKILFCGDHLLNTITPNITYWGPEFGDALGIYFKHLRKVYDMDIDLLLSSHRELIPDYRARILELFQHHNRRLTEVLKALQKNGPLTSREVASQMHWDITVKNFKDFPDSQKWFAVGEADAHLVYLMAGGWVDKETKDGVNYYYAKEKTLPDEPLASLERFQ